MDGVYFRMKRDGRYENVCFIDLTKEERERVLENRSAEWLKSLVCHLADTIQMLAKEFGGASDEEDDLK